MSQKETETTENKSSLSELNQAIVAMAAFATSKGGVVHFGITPEGKKSGIQIGKNTLENLANDVRRNTDPPIFPSIEVEGDESSAIIHVSVEESPIKPVWAFGKPYKRVGRTNQSLSREETQRLVETTTGRTWDALPCSGLKEKDLSRAAIEDFLKRSSQDASTPTKTVIDNLKLRSADGSLCNAAALLFAKNVRHHLVGTDIKCGRFRGDSPIDFIDEQTIEGTLFEQLEQALAFVKRNTRQAIKITGKPEREIIPEYPEEAIREAIINAICHRDYTESGNVQVRIFESGLDIWNPGKLPHSISVKSLYKKHSSHPRNKILADAFYRSRLIENWGTGTLRIVAACEERGMTRPVFKATPGLFMVHFASQAIESDQTKTAHLTERQNKTLKYISEHGAITSIQYQNLFDVKKRQAQKDLTAMVTDNLLVVEGRGPSTRYRVRD